MWYDEVLTTLYRNPLPLHLELRVLDQQVVTGSLFQLEPRFSEVYISPSPICHTEAVKTHHQLRYGCFRHLRDGLELISRVMSDDVRMVLHGRDRGIVEM